MWQQRKLEREGKKIKRKWIEAGEKDTKQIIDRVQTQEEWWMYPLCMSFKTMFLGNGAAMINE